MGLISKLKSTTSIKDAYILKKYKPPKISDKYYTDTPLLNLFMSRTSEDQFDNTITALVSKDSRYKLEILIQEMIDWFKSHTKTKHAVAFIDILKDNDRIAGADYFNKFPDLIDPINSKRLLYIPCADLEEARSEMMKLLNAPGTKDKLLLLVNGLSY